MYQNKNSFLYRKQYTYCPRGLLKFEKNKCEQIIKTAERNCKVPRNLIGLTLTEDSLLNTWGELNRRISKDDPEQLETVFARAVTICREKLIIY